MGSPQTDTNEKTRQFCWRFSLWKNRLSFLNCLAVVSFIWWCASQWSQHCWTQPSTSVEQLRLDPFSPKTVFPCCPWPQFHANSAPTKADIVSGFAALFERISSCHNCSLWDWAYVSSRQLCVNIACHLINKRMHLFFPLLKCGWFFVISLLVLIWKSLFAKKQLWHCKSFTPNSKEWLFHSKL